MKDDIQDLLKHATKLQNQMQEAQTKLEQQDVVGAAGGGLVEVIMNGRHDVSNVKISEEVMDDKDILEDLIAGAINDAVRKVDKISQEALENMAVAMPNMNIPNFMR